MNRRRATSGGQAIVMVTLSLLTMCGMMGLAVDLGWSYFVQKQAQAAADAGALGAVHEMYVRANGATSSVTCGTNAECKTALSPPALCSAISASSNLYNGCSYALLNGFPNTKVYVVSNVGGAASTPPPPVTGIPATNIAYWATYRTFTTIPQLFSAVLGNTSGTVAAKATAAVVAVTVPGSFLGMNHEGDCQTDSGGAAINCGVDLDVGGAGNGQCYDSLGVATVSASVCGPAGIYLASQCHGTASVGGEACGSTTNGVMDAGQTHGSANVWGSVNRAQGSGYVNDPSKWSAALTNGGGGKQFGDPTLGEAQPPVAPSLGSGTAITPCAVTSTTLSGNLGPFQYYYADPVTHKATGAPLSLAANATFSAGGTCPTGGTSNLASQSFPSYVFYGGLDLSNVNTTTGTTFGPGQYVMAGTTSQTGTVLTGTSGNFTGDSTNGTMFILTDASYPTLVNPPAITTAIQNGTTFYEGSTYFKNNTGSLNGMNITADSSLSQYAGTLFWQDRRNTSLEASGHYDANGNWVSGACTTATCGSTATSPNFALDHGNPSMTMTGVLYQPRGAWMTINAGTGAVANSHLQVITGSLVFTNGGGNAQVVLLGPTLPMVTFRTTLIQ